MVYLHVYCLFTLLFLKKTSCRIKSFSVVTMVDTNLSILTSIPILLSDSLRYVIYALNP